ncbi:holo-ACP synthase, partial [Vibrio parahaemolyticus]|nr:holo-ACP synthase [Vibrio parahaemolyticus]
MLTGIDIVKNERIQKLIQTNKDTFYKRVFTKDEINYIRDKRDSIGTIAGLFAAKEAVSKMLGTGIGEISWTDIEICHRGKGKPYLNINDKLKTIFRMLGIKEVDISISNEKEFSIAVAVAVSNKGLEVGIPNNM